MPARTFLQISDPEIQPSKWVSLVSILVSPIQKYGSGKKDWLREQLNRTTAPHHQQTDP